MLFYMSCVIHMDNNNNNNNNTSDKIYIYHFDRLQYEHTIEYSKFITDIYLTIVPHLMSYTFKTIPGCICSETLLRHFENLNNLSNI